MGDIMEKFIKDIRNNYRKLEHELVTQLSYEVEHNVTMGTNREEIWVEFFKRIIPKKFNIARSVFIIDSYNKCSKEVDIAIYDEQYTPYIFNYGIIKFIPIEAVAAVVQCKSKSLPAKNLLDWTESITKLKTSQDSIARLANYVHIGKNSNSNSIQTATTPIKILCYIKDKKTANEANKKNKTDEINEINEINEAKASFDIVIEAYQKKKNEEKTVQNQGLDFLGNLDIVFNKNKNLYDVLCQYNRNSEAYDEKGIGGKLKERKLSDYIVSDGEEKYTLLSFIFQFNQMLMMINNPMFFPHMAYVEMFNDKERGEGE